MPVHVLPSDAPVRGMMDDAAMPVAGEVDMESKSNTSGNFPCIAAPQFPIGSTRFILPWPVKLSWPSSHFTARYFAFVALTVPRSARSPLKITRAPILSRIDCDCVMGLPVMALLGHGAIAAAAAVRMVAAGNRQLREFI